MFRRSHPVGTCPWCGRQQPIGAAGACRSCQCAARAAQALRRKAGAFRPRPVRSSRCCYSAAAAGRPHQLRAGPRLGAGHAAPGLPRRDRRAGQPGRARSAAVGGCHAAAVPEPAEPGRAAGGRVPHRPGPGPAQPAGPPSTGGWQPGSLPCPAPFAAEVRTWTEALQGRGPRAGPARQARTIQGYLRILQNPLASWAAQYESLRQVTTDDLTGQLGPADRRRPGCWPCRRCGRCSARSRPAGCCSPTPPRRWPAAESSHRRSCRSMTACAPACSAACTAPPSGSSCCWPGCTRCARPTSAP